MHWYRSWPSDGEIAEKRLNDVPHVVDGLPRMIMSGYDYKSVTDHNSLQTANGWPEDTPGFCMLEWDIALDPMARRQFASIAWEEPREVLVAPYRYHDTWVCWLGNDGEGPTLNSRPVKQAETRTDSFGLGCIYIPRSVLLECLGQMNKFGFSDGTFGHWYHQRYGQARVTWKVHPQHVHEYETETRP